MLLQCQLWFMKYNCHSMALVSLTLLDSSSKKKNQTQTYPNLFLYQLSDQLLKSSVKGTVRVLRNSYHFVLWMKLPMEINELFLFWCWNRFFFSVCIKLTITWCRKLCLMCILSHLILSSFLRAVAVQRSVVTCCFVLVLTWLAAESQ